MNFFSMRTAVMPRAALGVAAVSWRKLELNAANSDLEKSRQIVDQSSEQLEAVRIVKLTLEADLKKSKEETEYWKKAAAVTTSHNGAMN